MLKLLGVNKFRISLKNTPNHVTQLQLNCIAYITITNFQIR